MAYVSRWERLSDVATHVMTAAGVSKDEAQSDICRAIADRAIKIRCRLKRHKLEQMTSKTLLDGNAFEIPPRIKPDDLDWEGSRPVKPWTVRRGSYAIPGDWDLAWLELSRTDVTNVLCRAETRGESAQHASSETGAIGRSRPARERVHHAITKLYPEGVPGQAVEPNSKLCRRVGKKLKEEGLPDVSDDTILRAAGRRK
jgi:hypothetical protein